VNEPDLLHAVLHGDHRSAETLTDAALTGGVGPESLLTTALIPAMDEVGRRFEDGLFFLPDLLVAARAMKAALALIRPRLTTGGVQPLGTVVIGTVAGDQHDIGKNIVAAMLEGGGFEVIDLGYDVAPEAFCAAVRDRGARIVGLSALLTTTLPVMGATMAALQAAGLRDTVKVLIGGAPATAAFAAEIGADAYAAKGTLAVRLARAFVADMPIVGVGSAPAATYESASGPARTSPPELPPDPASVSAPATSRSLTSREIVKRTLDFASPPRIPRNLWLLPWAGQHHPEAVAQLQERFPDDFIGCPGYYASEPPCTGDPYAVGTYRDDWGCTFENLQSGIIGDVKQPLLNDWGDLDKVHIPREKLSLDIAKANAFCRATDRFVMMGRCPRPFERLQFLRGTANLLMDLVDRPPELLELIDRMHTFYCEELSLWARTDVDALSIMDDWGSQHSLLIAPDTWRELFKPLYRDYIEIAHGAGKYLFMHSDGYILDILPDLIELGLDALNSQIFCVGLDEVGRFAGRITFWGELDRQQILPHASRRETAAVAERMRSTLFRDGGFIAQCEFGPGARPENVYTFFATLEGAPRVSTRGTGCRPPSSFRP